MKLIIRLKLCKNKEQDFTPSLFLFQEHKSSCTFPSIKFNISVTPKLSE